MLPSPASPSPSSSARSTAILASLLLLRPVLGAASQPAAPLPTLPDLGAAAAPADNHQHYNANRRAQQPSGPYTPLVTPAPSAVPDDVALQNQGFRQETYYTCVTALSGREHCGWHTPVLKQPKQGSGAAAVAVAAPGSRATDTRVVVAVVAALAGLFAVGMM